MYKPRNQIFGYNDLIKMVFDHFDHDLWNEDPIYYKYDHNHRDNFSKFRNSTSSKEWLQQLNVADNNGDKYMIHIIRKHIYLNM